MLTNLLWPWVLARLLAGVCTAVLCTHALLQARGALRPAADSSASEARLASERKAELSAAVVRAALVFGALSLALTVLAADGLSHAVKGAMCAWGVFESGHGFGALGSSAALTLAAGTWLGLHRYDFALERPVLTAAKFRALGWLVPLAWLDLALNARFFYALDLGAAASCCSAGLEAVRTQLMPGSQALARGSVALGALGLGVLAVSLLTLAARRPTRARVRGSVAVSLAAVLVALPAILWYVAPHAYETPHHNCPFCLLHADVWGLGWLLFGALMWGAIDSLSLWTVQRLRPPEQADVTSATLSHLSQRAAVAFGVALACGVFPVLRFAWITGGSSLF